MRDRNRQRRVLKLLSREVVHLDKEHTGLPLCAVAVELVRAMTNTRDFATCTNCLREEALLA